MKFDKIMNTIKSDFPFKDYILENSRGDIYRTVYYVANRFLSEKSNVLDFGCGACDKIAVVALLGHDCIAYDDFQDEWHRESDNHKKIINFSKKIGVKCIDSLGCYQDSQVDLFDMIMLNDVIEHLHESPRDILITLLGLLKNDGVLFLTVPNAGNIKKRLTLLFGGTNFPPFYSYFWYSGAWRGHIREYVYNDLIELSNYLDLDVELIYGCDHMLEKVPTMLLPLYKIVTYFFPKWKDSWTLIAKKRPGWSPMLLADINEFNN